VLLLELIMKSSDRLDRLRIASPCPVGWDQMTGDDRVRFCQRCSLRVYNISEMTRTEAEALIAKTEGHICARIYRRFDGTIITKDCPVGLRAMRRRAARVAGAVVATTLSLGSLVLGQKPSKKDSCQPQIKISRSLPKSPDPVATISGTIYDPNRAVIPGATVTLTDETTKQTRQVTSKDDGTFQILGLPAGTYDFQVERQAFAKAVVKKLRFNGSETVNLDLILLIDPHAVTMGILIFTENELLDRDGATIKTVFSGDLIRRLPIHE
jgi:hypothetical protein